MTTPCRATLFAIILAVGTTLAQNPPATNATEPAIVTDLAVNKGPIYNKALDDLTVDSRQPIIDALIAHLTKAPLTGVTKDVGLARVVVALGRLHAEEAVKPLAARLSLAFPPTSGVKIGLNRPPFTPPDEALCQPALISIGKASLRPVLADYDQTHQDALGHANVIVGVLDDDPDLAKAWLTKHQSYSRKATDELIAAIDAQVAKEK